MEDVVAYFEAVDAKKKVAGNYVTSTAKGIFGVSDTHTIIAFFKKINLEQAEHFVDLGSGDGRVAIIASFFTRATGIEYDATLAEESRKHANALGSGAVFLQQDYEMYSYHNVDILFSYADHEFSDVFIKKLQEEFEGTLYIYQGVFLPNATKGKTEWANQTPFISYTFGNRKKNNESS